VAAEFGRGVRHDDDVARAGGDRLVAARAEIGLAGLVRLDPADFDVVVG
jgi:hypothetical protein